MTKFLKLLHNWLGFIISLVMLIVLTTGIYLGSVDLIKRFDDKGQTYSSLTAEQKAQIAAHIITNYPTATAVKLPTATNPYVEAYSREKSVFLTTELTEINTQLNANNHVWRWLFFFHRNFQLGEAGMHANAISAVLATIIMFIGLYLWWLIKKGFRWKQTLPKNTKNSALIKSHIQLGLLFSIPLLVMAISGAYITYGFWGESTLDENKPTPVIAHANNWQAQILAAQKLWPKSKLVSISKPRTKEGDSYIYSLSFNDDTMFGLQQTDTIKIDLHNGQLQSAQTFKEKSLAYQLKYIARFLHDGARMPTWYLIMLIVSSIFGTAMNSFIIVTFIRKEIFVRINMKLTKKKITEAIK
ncbi:PepSY-associated TM helix domain-containing protein [Thalassotalea fonticola]|uniref:PepSY-associated TM helix domain-containing protein n=1 Tax=Thalassotalea fonticola TaxID=3065649 RepID=A0ABZ0GS11_9GAMM|nr:PepSY-associated TM helix domain-containing protein [Colwelliaceae bacterium S1-1]